MPEELRWRERLYNAYVSSGQANFRSDAAIETPIETGLSSKFRQLTDRHIPRNPDTRIVDLGCGHAALLRFLSRAGYRNILGVDSSAEQIAVARRLGVLQAEHGSIEDFLSRAADASSDVVLMMDVLEHFTRDELFRVLDGVLRVLRKGGKCVAHVPNAEGLFGMRVRYGDLTHEQAFTPKSVTQLFVTVGFGKVNCYEDIPTVHGARSLVRRWIWTLGALPYRLLLTAETGVPRGFILTQNMFVEACK